MQLKLPFLASLEELKPEDKSAFSDPSFASNKLLPVHRWVPWIAGFSSGFVRGIIEDKLDERAIVLDPFAGVGTTLVEATLMGHDGIGFEINPYAALACRVKVNAHKLNWQDVRREVSRLQEFYNHTVSNGYSPISKPPSGFRSRKAFYSLTVLRKVLIIQDFINRLNNEQTQEVFKLAFASTMVHYSNYSYEPSLGTRSAAGKSDIEDFPVLDIIAEKLNRMILDIEEIGDNIYAGLTNARIINSSFFDYEQHIEANSIDVAITSPPYLNNYHYIRNTRPHLYWLGFVKNPNDTKPLEHQNFGKYWQTVRELDAVNLTFPDPPVELIDKIAYLRTLNLERGIYSGNGWANYAASYFNDCYRFAQGLRYALKPGSSAFIVIGNSILQGVMIPTDLYLSKIAERSGLELVSINILRATRVGNSIIQSDVRVAKADSSHRLYESVVELRQPR
ncbi:MAG: site-specific DNA-methyltransferase [Coleofasciculus sp. S288]|nr:site-specific DNA-methyltransferase [Coleofasciculus sp. S288]